MTKKNYIATAEILRGEHNIASAKSDHMHRAVAQTAVENITASLADMFAADNSLFDRDRFYTAALGRKTLRP